MKLFHAKHFLALENYKIHVINIIMEAIMSPTLEQLPFLERAFEKHAVVALASAIRNASITTFAGEPRRASLKIPGWKLLSS